MIVNIPCPFLLGRHLSKSLFPKVSLVQLLQRKYEVTLFTITYIRDYGRRGDFLSLLDYFHALPPIVPEIVDVGTKPRCHGS